MKRIIPLDRRRLGGRSALTTFVCDGAIAALTPLSRPRRMVEPVANPLADNADDSAAALDTSVHPGDGHWATPDAPVTVIEYASYTCPHCATFHGGVFKELKTRLHRHRQNQLRVP